MPEELISVCVTPTSKILAFCSKSTKTNAFAADCTSGKKDREEKGKKELDWVDGTVLFSMGT